MKNKKIFISIMIFILLISFSTFCFAEFNPNHFQTDAPNAGLLGDVINFNNILSIIQWIGIAVAVAYLIVMGIKFMLGSVDDKAEIKKRMAPYFIGLVIILGITTITNVVANLAKKLK